MKKDQYGWTNEATAAFDALKQALAQAPVLAMPDFNKEFLVETDASGFGLGAVLIQDGHPIAYYSKILGTRSRLKSIYEKELMAIVLAVLKWKHYLFGRRFTIRTDQQSLKYLMEQREVDPEYQGWVSKLMGFDFEIQYKPGPSNRVADALSRQQVHLGELNTLISSGGIQWGEVQAILLKDPFIKQIREDLEGGKQVPKGYYMEYGVLKYKGRVVLPANCSLIPKLLHTYHDTPLGGHSGELKTYQRIATSWFWSGMRRTIAKYVQACVVC